MLRGLLERADREPSADTYLRAVVGLCGERVLVPVVATATRLGEVVGGLASDKEAEMAVVMLQRGDGERALLAFTGLDSLAAWQDGARPVPVTLDAAAQAATSEGGVAIVVDVAGPHPLVVDGDLLGRLASGHRLVEASSGEFGWAIAAGADRE